MCDDGPFIFRKENKCFFCGGSPAVQTDDYSDEYTYCETCAIEIFGEELVSQMEGSELWYKSESDIELEVLK